MPKMSKWIGDLSEKYFSKYYKETVVSEIEYYDKKLKRVRFQSEELKKVDWEPAKEVEFRVTDTEYRHYTPMNWNKDEGYTDILFYLHDKGPGSVWAEKLNVNDSVLLIGPEGKFVAKKSHKKIVMLGDETSLSTYYGIQELLNKSENHCVLEMKTEHKEWADKINLSAEVIGSNELGLNSEKWLTNFIKNQDAKSYTYFLSGNADVVKKLRRILVKKIIYPKQIFTHMYWKEGKKGL